MFLTGIVIILTATVISYLSTPIAIRIAKKFKLVTDITQRSHPAHTHTGIIPRGGGIPIFIALLVSSIVFLPMNQIIIGILITNALLLIVGLWDDKYDVSPYKRFGLNLIISVILVMFGLGIPFISNPFGGVIRLDLWKISVDI